MTSLSSASEARVAVLVDCDNVPPEILAHALRMAAQFGRVVLRRGYGNQTTLAQKWQEALIRLAFTPHLQYQYVNGKNTADIALALDALEAHFDNRADTFCLVTSDSDFAYLCRKLRERGATVCIVGEAKSPDALRNASDHFFEWDRSIVADGTAPEDLPPSPPKPKTSPRKLKKAKADEAKPTKAKPPQADETKPEITKPTPKRHPEFVVEAVALLTSDTSEDKVSLNTLGQYLKRTDPAFSPKTYGHSGLLNMIKTYTLLATQQNTDGQWFVSPTQAAEPGKTLAPETTGD